MDTQYACFPLLNPPIYLAKVLSLSLTRALTSFSMDALIRPALLVAALSSVSSELMAAFKFSTSLALTSFTAAPTEFFTEASMIFASLDLILFSASKRSSNADILVLGFNIRVHFGYHIREQPLHLRAELGLDAPEALS